MKETTADRRSATLSADGRIETTTTATHGTGARRRTRKSTTGWRAKKSADGKNGATRKSKNGVGLRPQQKSADDKRERKQSADGKKSSDCWMNSARNRRNEQQNTGKKGYNHDIE